MDHSCVDSRYKRTLCHVSCHKPLLLLVRHLLHDMTFAPTLWERSAAERCLIHAETVSLFRSLVAFQPMLTLSEVNHFR